MNNIFEKLHPDYVKKFNNLPASDTKSEVYHALITTKHFGQLLNKYAEFLEETLLKKDENILDMMYDIHIESSKNKTSFGEAGINIKSGWGF
jgi:hypothetical protein